MDKMDHRIRVTKQLIKEALLQALEKKDIYHVTVKELCGMAQINRSTFYAHYESPQDVLREIEQDVARNITALGQNCDPENKFEHLLRACEYLYANRDIQKAIMRNNSDEDIAKALAGSTVYACLPAGYIADTTSLDDVDRAFAYTFLVYGMFHVVRKWLLQDVDRTPAQMAVIMERLIDKHL